MHFKNNVFEIFGNIFMIHLFRDEIVIFKLIMFNGVLNYYHLVKHRSSFYNFKHFILNNHKKNKAVITFNCFLF